MSGFPIRRKSSSTHPSLQTNNQLENVDWSRRVVLPVQLLSRCNNFSSVVSTMPPKDIDYRQLSLRAAEYMTSNKPLKKRAVSASAYNFSKSIEKSVPGLNKQLTNQAYHSTKMQQHLQRLEKIKSQLNVNAKTKCYDIKKQIPVTVELDLSPLPSLLTPQTFANSELRHSNQYFHPARSMYVRPLKLNYQTPCKAVSRAKVFSSSYKIVNASIDNTRIKEQENRIVPNFNNSNNTGLSTTFVSNELITQSTNDQSVAYLRNYANCETSGSKNCHDILEEDTNSALNPYSMSDIFSSDIGLGVLNKKKLLDGNNGLRFYSCKFRNNCSVSPIDKPYVEKMYHKPLNNGQLGDCIDFVNEEVCVQHDYENQDSVASKFDTVNDNSALLGNSKNTAVTNVKIDTSPPTAVNLFKDKDASNMLDNSSKKTDYNGNTVFGEADYCLNRELTPILSKNRASIVKPDLSATVINNTVISANKADKDIIDSQLYAFKLDVNNEELVLSGANEADKDGLLKYRSLNKILDYLIQKDDLFCSIPTETSGNKLRANGLKCVKSLKVVNFAWSELADQIVRIHSLMPEIKYLQLDNVGLVNLTQLFDLLPLGQLDNLTVLHDSQVINKSSQQTTNGPDLVLRQRKKIVETNGMITRTNTLDTDMLSFKKDINLSVGINDNGINAPGEGSSQSSEGSLTGQQQGVTISSTEAMDTVIKPSEVTVRSLANLAVSKAGQFWRPFVVWSLGASTLGLKTLDGISITDSERDQARRIFKPLCEVVLARSRASYQAYRNALAIAATIPPAKSLFSSTTSTNITTISITSTNITGTDNDTIVETEQSKAGSFTNPEDVTGCDKVNNSSQSNLNNVKIKEGTLLKTINLLKYDNLPDYVSQRSTNSAVNLHAFKEVLNSIRIPGNGQFYHPDAALIELSCKFKKLTMEGTGRCELVAKTVSCALQDGERRAKCQQRLATAWPNLLFGLVAEAVAVDNSGDSDNDE